MADGAKIDCIEFPQFFNSFISQYLTCALISLAAQIVMGRVQFETILC